VSAAVQHHEHDEHDVRLDEPRVIVAGGLRWLPEDADATPVGWALAVETAAGGAK
jgi:hypothetical protein